MRVKIKLTTYNIALVEARKAAGMTQIQLSNFSNVPVNIISAIELLRRPPNLEKMQEYTEAIAMALEIPYHEIFPLEYFEALERRLLPSWSNHKLFEWEHEISLDQLPADERFINLPDDIDNKIDQEFAIQQIKKALEFIPLRENEIIKYLYGIDEERSHTIEETAAKYNVSRERIRQIEATALSRLRHPAIRKFLPNP